jgi:hypothetical protein
LGQMSDLTSQNQFYLLFGSFGPPPLTMDSAANKRKMAELVAQRHRDNKVDSTFISPKPTSLYVNKTVDKDVDLLAIFGNFETFAGAFVDNMYTLNNMPSAVAMTTMIFSILIQDNGRRWIVKMFETYSNFGKFMVTKMNLLVMLYVHLAKAASMMHSDDPVPHLANYFCIEDQFKHFVAELQSALSVYTIPHSMCPVARGFHGTLLIHPMVPPQVHHYPQAIARNGGNSNPTGVVCHPGLVPVTARIMLPASQSGDQRPICLNHLLLGRTCS